MLWKSVFLPPQFSSTLSGLDLDTQLFSVAGLLSSAEASAASKQFCIAHIDVIVV